MSVLPYLKQCAEEALNGCILKAENGCALYTPDGKGNYPALWTRDYAYMAEYAGDLIPPDKQKACIDFLIAGARSADGWIPDRVDTRAVAAYTAGGPDFPALPNLDNGPFLVLAAEAYLAQLTDAAAAHQFDLWKSALCRGITCLPVNADGLIANTTTPLHSPYGFTDCICKSGALAMESLLLWRALRILAKRGAGASFADWAANIEQAFAPTFTDGSGMLLAATGIGRQIDIWASCYAVSIGFPLAETQKVQIADWLAAHFDGLTLNGQIRHLPAGEFWEKTLVPVGEGEYQNGAYWATATGWFYDAIEAQYPALAAQLMADVTDFFRNDGIWECINRDGYRKLHPYVASVTNVYGCLRRHRFSEGFST